MILKRMLQSGGMVSAMITLAFSMNSRSERMDGEISRETISIPEKDFEAFKRGYIPNRSYCQKVMDSYTKEKNLPRSLVDSNAEKDKKGGNGVNCFTLDGKYAIRRGIDEKAYDSKKSENTVLEIAANQIIGQQQKNSKIFNSEENFDVILPLKVFDLSCETGSSKCKQSSIQIYPKVSVFEVNLNNGNGNDRGDVAGIIRHYLKWHQDDKLYLKVMYDLGAKMANFQMNFPITPDKNAQDSKRKSYFMGVQHGDFNPGNILITNINESKGTANFSLIDLPDFRTKGRLVSDAIYFVYWTGKILLVNDLKLDPNDKQNQRRMKDLIENFYAGYVSALSDKVLEEMNTKIFTDKNYPLKVAMSEDSFTYQYPKDFKEHITNNPWLDLLSDYQFDAFKKAYAERVGMRGAMPKSTYSTGSAIPTGQSSVPYVFPDKNVNEPYQTVNRSNTPSGWDQNDPQNFSGPSQGEQKNNGTVLNLSYSNLANNERKTDLGDIFRKENNLQELNLSKNPEIKFMDEIKFLGNPGRLKKLDLSGTSVEATFTLSPVYNLEELDLSGTPVIYVGSLNSLKNLKVLNLSNTKVNDIQSGLLELGSLSKLEILNLSNTKVSRDFMGQLQKALPNTTIIR